MDVNVEESALTGRPQIVELRRQLLGVFTGVPDASLLLDYPLHTQDDGRLLSLDALVVSPETGIWVIFARGDTESPSHFSARRGDVFSNVYSKLLRNPSIRKKRTELKIDVREVIFDPFVQFKETKEETAEVCRKESELKALFHNSKAVDHALAHEALATLDGSKAIIRSRERPELDGAARKGNVARMVENEMTLLDNRQRRAGSVLVGGPQRIRGIAGTGKTVILSMKAALAHLKDPGATIVYTFYTKGLYQHVKRLITRFYRQFSDRDPDWTKVLVMHAWGGRAYPGVYYDISRKSGAIFHTYKEASMGASKNGAASPFEWVCTELLKGSIRPIYDYMFIDEGQDFPNAFINLGRRATKKDRIVWAYDEMQNIFDVKIPTQEEVFGGEAQIVDDLVLFRSYRNPREVLVAAHALGFGIYSGRILQMLESVQHWEDLGYKVNEGTCRVGDEMAIERPEANSSSSVSQHYKFAEIISCKVFDSFDLEIEYVVESIVKCIEDGLRPDDILVEVVDDLSAKTYASKLEAGLLEKGIASHSLHKNPFDIVDFQLEESVTISTVYKAKGNEAFQVFVVGVDALFFHESPLARNRLFTAITRAKGWVALSGMGEAAKKCVKELAAIQRDFPCLKFEFPDPAKIRVMQRDLTKEARKKMNAERLLEEVQQALTPEEIRAYLERERKDGDR